MTWSPPTAPLPELFRAAAARYPGRTAILGAAESLSLGEVDALSNRLAAGLGEMGLMAGDRIGLYAYNSPRFALAYLGALKAGATVVPVNVLLHPRELAYVLGDAGAVGLIYSAALSPSLDDLLPRMAPEPWGVALDGAPARARHRGWEALIAHDAPPPARGRIAESDLAAILYTSGTTGRPKGAMLSHRNLAANALSTRLALKVRPGEDVFLVVLPMFHAFAATVGMLTPLLHGAALVPLPRFEPEAVARAIARHGATVFLGVPSMYQLLMRLPEAAAPLLDSLRLCVSGGAAMPVDLMRRFEARFGLPIYEGDGPTECSPVTCLNPVGGRRKPGSVGLPVPGVEMRILDPEGQQRPPGENGEICVRGANVMRGYWRRPEDTTAAFHGRWFRTGDLGYQDRDGYFFILDRIKDLIIVNGMNVYPRMVEEVLVEMEGVAEAAVVGEPDPTHGEVPVAYVVLEAGYALDTAGLRRQCLAHLGRHQVPRRIHFLESLPRTVTGKVLKRALTRRGELERGVKPPDAER